MTEQALAIKDEKAMATRIERARWLKDIGAQDRDALVHLSVEYGLDPLMRELTLYEGAPYITLAGLIRIAHRQKQFAGIEDRPMTEDERKQYGYKSPVCWMVKVYRSDWKVPAVGTGQADPANPNRNNPVEKARPEWLGRSRAMRQALKLAFPHSLPFEQLENAEEQGIDPETGEIFDRPEILYAEVAEVIGQEDIVTVEVQPEPEEPPVKMVNPGSPLAKRWEELVQEARALGIKETPLKLPCQAASAIEAGRALKELIAKAKAETF